MSEQPFAWHVGVCPQCERPNRTIGPLHGSEGGPPFCLQCGMEWHGKHGRKRRLARNVIKAMQMYYKAGGELEHVEQFAKKTFCLGIGLPDSFRTGANTTNNYVYCVLLNRVYENRFAGQEPNEAD